MILGTYIHVCIWAKFGRDNPMKAMIVKVLINFLYAAHLSSDTLLQSVMSQQYNYI